jgi:nucleoside-diphosphate-sugar epimerase
MTRKVLIIGATGTIGKHITAAIAESSKSFDRVAIFTSPSTAESKKDVIENLKKQGVETIVGDLSDDEQVKSAFSGMLAVASVFPAS